MSVFEINQLGRDDEGCNHLRVGVAENGTPYGARQCLDCGKLLPQGPPKPPRPPDESPEAIRARNDAYWEHATREQRELAALREERAHLYRVAEAARQLCLSITHVNLYPTSKKWQANGTDNTLPKLEEATEAWCEWGRKTQRYA